jgi:hypothetical protein
MRALRHLLHPAQLTRSCHNRVLISGARPAGAQPTEPPARRRHGVNGALLLARTYRQVLANQKGDFESTNPSFAAKELAAWLLGVFKGVDRC